MYELDGIELEEITCLECDYTGEPVVTKSYEFDDRDGNRGVYLVFIECENCGADLKGVIDE